MAEVDTPADLKLRWNPSGTWPSIATGVHGAYHVVGSGPRFDVYYRTVRDGEEVSEKLASDLSGGQAYTLCKNHNKQLVGITGDTTSGQEQPIQKRREVSQEPSCPDCGTIHAGDCW